MVFKLRIKKYNSSSGFSLMELMVVITILVLMSTALMSLFASAWKTYKYNHEMIGSEEQAAIGIRAFEKTTRAASQIIEATASTLTFLAYQKGDSYPAPSKISLYVTDTNFYKSVIPPTPSGATYVYTADPVITLITGNVSGQNIFSYYNEANTLIAIPPALDAIKMISCTLTIDQNPNQAPAGIPITTKVELRNLKTNL